jgi:hypothetical protein
MAAPAVPHASGLARQISSGPPPRPAPPHASGLARQVPTGVSPTLHASVGTVLHAQAPAQQDAIVRGAQRAPNNPVSRSVLAHASIPGWRGQSPGVRPGSGGGDLLGHLASGVYNSTVGAGLGDIRGLLGESVAHGLGASGAAVPAATIAGTQIPGAPKILEGVGQGFKNAAGDVWSLPMLSVMGGFEEGKLLAQGKFGQAAANVYDPYIRFLENPGSTFFQHPVDTAMMFGGAETLAGRLAGRIARSGAAGERAAAFANTARAPMSIGTDAEGNPLPISDRARSYSENLITQSLQKAHERLQQSRGHDPNVAGATKLPGWVAYAVQRGAQAKLYRIADEMTAVRQMVGRITRAQKMQEVLAARPHAGANLVAHVLQGAIRTPETAVADAHEVIARLQEAGKTLPRGAAKFWNNLQIKDLQKVVGTNPERPIVDQAALHGALEGAAKLRPLIHKQDAQLLDKGMLTEAQASRRLFPYAQTHMGYTWNKATGELTDPHGHPFNAQHITDHLDEHGVPDPAYVQHSPFKTGSKQYYRAFRMSREAVGGAARTGEAFRVGGYDHTYEGLAGQIAGHTQKLANTELHDRIIRRVGIGKYGGGLYNGREAALAIDASRDAGATPLVGIVAGSKTALDYLPDPHEHNVDFQQLEQQHVANSIDQATERIRNRSNDTRNIVLLPKDLTDRLAKQFKAQSDIAKGMGRITQQFRRTVLPYSTHWMTQIATEAVLRSMMSGDFSPRYLLEGHRVKGALGQDSAGLAASSEMFGSTFFPGKNDLMAIHNANPSKLISTLHTAPISRQIIGAHNAYADTVGHFMKEVEQQARLAHLGKMSQDWGREFTGSWGRSVRLQGHVVDALVHQLKTDPALVAKFGRSIDETLGRYNKFTPVQRALVQSAFPFLPWYLNAAKTVFMTLPLKHPVASATLAALRQTMYQDVQDGKLLPLNSWATQEAARLTPFGIFSPPSSQMNLGNFIQGQQVIPDALFPQAMGSINNLQGLNSFGSGPLTSPTGDVKSRSTIAGEAAGNSLIQALLPWTHWGQLLMERGQKTYSASTPWNLMIKPGQTPESIPETILNRIINPLYAFEAAQNTPNAPQYMEPGRSQSPLNTVGGGGGAIGGGKGAVGGGAGTVGGSAGTIGGG